VRKSLEAVRVFQSSTWLSFGQWRFMYAIIAFSMALVV